MNNKPRTFRYFTAWSVVGWIGVFLVISLSLVPKAPEFLAADSGNHLGHFLAYMLIMSWFVQLHTERAWCSFAMGFMLLGFVLEVLQGLLGYRHFDLLDLAANCLGVSAGWALGSTRMVRLLAQFDARLAGASHRRL